MKTVQWIDRNGKRRISLIRDSDPDEMAPDGIPLEPPDLDQIDWNGIKTELHDLILERGLYTWQDIQQQQGALTSMVTSTVRRHLAILYKRIAQDEAQQIR